MDEYEQDTIDNQNKDVQILILRQLKKINTKLEQLILK